ncbi:MAG: hypothetical protein H8E44_02175, partial [Planctomycetes bacterium]|nr:hypothetical protein [Planctomycetota bacterium]
LITPTAQAEPVKRLAYRIREAAESCGMCERSFHSLLASGDGPPVVRLNGRTVLVPVDTLRTWLTERARASEQNGTDGDGQGDGAGQGDDKEGRASD